jgi:hypothetical protein
MDQNTLRNRVSINSSPQLLYQYISTPLDFRWFAIGHVVSFFTLSGSSEEKARLASKNGK